MQRRQLLQRLACTATTGLGLAAATAAPATQAAAGASTSRPEDFDAAAAQQPLLTPLKGVTDTSGHLDGTAMLRGRWPAGLRGRFYRNGPALFERGGQRYHHWFDGDGMVQQFRIGAGAVQHRGRLVGTVKLRAEQQAGRFLMPTLGTHIDGGPPISGPDAVNPANTNALEHVGRVLAMWEGGSAYGMDPHDLATQGPVVWRPDAAQLPFSAHPKVDRAGHLWNIGIAGKRLIVWHVDPQGALARVQLAALPFFVGMVHDMAVTERHIVVPLPPVGFDFTQRPAEGRRRFAMKPDEPLRVLVMEKTDITRQRVFELPPEMIFHVGNAHDTHDGEVVLSYVGAPDAWFLDEGAVALLAGRPAVTRNHVQARQLRLHMPSGRSEVQSFPGEVEFPRVHPQHVGLPARWLLAAAGWPAHAGRQASALLHGLLLLDTHTGRARRFDYGADVIAEEHVIVPKPGKMGELDAWLLGTTFDARRQATVLNLLDAAHIEDGPIAQAVLPYALPLGFHGNFTAA